MTVATSVDDARLPDSVVAPTSLSAQRHCSGNGTVRRVLEVELRPVSRRRAKLATVR